MSLKQRILLALVILGSLIGLLDTSFLVGLQLKKQQALECDLLGFGCDKVLNSSYSRFLNLPLSFWGLFYYSALFLAAIIYLSAQKRVILRLIELWLWLGAAVSLYLLFLQTRVLKAFCPFCLISDLTILVLTFSYLMIKLISLKNK